MTESKLNVITRDNTGKKWTKKMRRQGQIPGIFYQHGKKNILISINTKELVTFLHHETGLISASFNGKEVKKCVIRELQTDPVSREPIHIDLMGVSMTEKLTVNVPIHLHGTPDGVKNQGGTLSQVLREIEIECLPNDIPEHIELDVSALSIGDTLTTEAIVADKFEIIGESDRLIATVSAPRVSEEEEEEAEAEAAEPELVGKKEEEEE
ncbi:50S ribosomal protein L25 [candidate division KSB1 bacterium]|nr:50S ribosomal protein L25 [candidate division KSB1 bacterium]